MSLNFLYDVGLNKPALDRSLLDHHINILAKEGLIEPIREYYGVAGYALTDKGRNYFLDNNLQKHYA